MGLLSLAFMAVLGCTAEPPASVAPSERYHALGTEPFWGVEIAGGQMKFDMHDEVVSVPVPAPRATATGRRYETERLLVDIRPGVCNDGMSDNLYADTVIVVVDGHTVHGCGGGRVPQDMLAHSSWYISEIDGEPIDGESYRLDFTADRISGSAGCNRFSGDYRRSGDTIIVGALATTRMACPGPRMDHERRALRVLSGDVQIGQTEGDLVLTGNGGRLRISRFWGPWPTL